MSNMVWLWVAVLTALTVVASLPTAYVGADGSSVNQNMVSNLVAQVGVCLLYTSPSPRD